MQYHALINNLQARPPNTRNKNAMTSRIRTILLAIIFSTASNIYSGEYVVGGVNIEIPAPVEYHNYLGLNPEIDRGLQMAANVNNNRVLAQFCSSEDLNMLIAGKIIAPKNTFDVQCDIDREKWEVTDVKFAEIQNRFVETLKGNDSALNRIMGETKNEIELSWQQISGGDPRLEMVSVGVVGTTRRSFTFGAFVRQDVGGAVLISYVNQTIICINGKLFSLHQTQYNPKTVTQFNQSSIAWAKAVEDAN